MSLLGLLLRLSYRLNRHLFMGFRTDGWAVLLLAAGASAAYLRGHPVWATALGAWGAFLLALTLVARHTGYVLFRRTPKSSLAAPPEPLGPEVELPVRASGWFSVQDQRRYLAWHPATYWTPRSREHILMAQLRRTRLMLVARSPSEDWGWWYLFVKPDVIEAVEPGRLYHGWRPTHSLRVRYRVENAQGEEEIAIATLSFDSEQARSLVWADLTRERRKHGPTPRL